MSHSEITSTGNPVKCIFKKQNKKENTRMQTDQASDRSSTRLVLALLPCCRSSQQEFQPPGSELVLVTRFHGILLSGNRKT